MIKTRLLVRNSLAVDIVFPKIFVIVQFLSMCLRISSTSDNKQKYASVMGLFMNFMLLNWNKG